MLLLALEGLLVWPWVLACKVASGDILGVHPTLTCSNIFPGPSPGHCWEWRDESGGRCVTPGRLVRR